MSIEFLACAKLPTEVGTFDFTVFKDTITGEEHVSMSYGEITGENMLMRIHSSCLTGECFLSMKCDCGPQLHTAMSMIQKEGNGLIVYLFQEGRGIGLVNKIKAYALQEQGLDTVQANEQLGFPADARTYDVVGAICKQLGITSCRLITNNPAKIDALKSQGIYVIERVSLEIPANTINNSYYLTKQSKMGHLFTHLAGSDEQYMQYALDQATLCKNTLPNPRVGAVVVKNNSIAGRGYTQTYGGHHAEVEALQDAGEQTIGATLYVTLEPCCYQGKTPPCTKAIIAAGIKKVVCAQGIDPNKQISGQGIQQLQDAGIEVVIGIFEDEAKKINEDIEFFYTKKRPFVCAKFAMTLDGKIATRSGDSKRITSEASRKKTRDLRKQYQAILVGKNTVIADNPHLGMREVGYVDPIRIVLDSTLATSLDAQIYRDDRVIVATTKQADPSRIDQFKQRCKQVLIFDAEQVPIDELFDQLFALHITGVLVEGGAEVLGSFFDAQCVDKVHLVHAPTLMGGTDTRSAIGGDGISVMSELVTLHRPQREIIDDDIHTTGYPTYSTTSS